MKSFRYIAVLVVFLSHVASAQQLGVLVVPPPMSKPAPAPTLLPSSSGGKAKILDVGNPIVSPTGYIKLGSGYNALTGEFIDNVCVVSNGKNIEIPAPKIPGGVNKKFINAVQDMQTNSEASGSSFGFGFTYKLISLGLNSGSTSDTYFNRSDAYGRIYVRIAASGTVIDNAIWSKPVGAPTIAGAVAKKDLTNFTRLCGTHFVRAIYKGFILDQTYHFQLRNTAHDSTSRNGLSVGVANLFNVAFSDQATVGNVQTLSTMTFDEASRGVIPNAPVSGTTTSIPTLVQYANTGFRDAVLAAGQDQAQQVMLELVPYSAEALPSSAIVPAWPNDILNDVDGQGGVYERFLTVLGDLNYAASFTDEAELKKLYKETLKTVSDKLAAATAMRKNYRDAVETCVKLLNSAKPTDDDRRKACEANLDAKMNDTLINPLRLQPS